MAMRDLRGEPADVAGSLLSSLGLSPSPLQIADGASNRVWLAPGHVVRLTSGRFRDSLAHEARVLRLLLPLDLPHAGVIAYGRTGRQVWLVLERVPGIALTAAWSALERGERATVARRRSRRSTALALVVAPAVARL
jgi:aminoglycoside phosphotransferase (APT) family kinase protein